MLAESQYKNTGPGSLVHSVGESEGEGCCGAMFRGGVQRCVQGNTACRNKNEAARKWSTGSGGLAFVTTYDVGPKIAAGRSRPGVKPQRASRQWSCSSCQALLGEAFRHWSW